MLVGPALAFMIVFLAWPASRNVEISLYQWNGIGPATFVGLQNYTDILSDDRMWGSLGNTVTFAVLSTIGSLTLGYALASALYERVRGWAVFRIAFFIPVMVPLTMTAILWGILLDPTYGPVNTLLQSLGVKSPPQWLGDTSLAMGALIAVTIWQYSGFPMIVFLAAMNRIPSEIQDAASIDGVGTWSRLRFITVPMTSRIIAIMGVISLIAGLQVFDVVFLMTGGGPGNSTEVFGTYLFRQIFNAVRVGYAAAVAVVMALAIFGVSIVYLRIIRPRRVEY